MQGVFFRSCAREQALHLGVRGWVRNLPSGDVEAVASGSPEAVDAFIAWCQHGPDQADVSSVAVAPDSSDLVFSTFSVLR